MLAVAIAGFAANFLRAEDPPAGQSDAMAIDVLLDPDQTMLEHAKAVNARLLENYPEGFKLDAQHTPHISTLQRYVRTADLDKVKAAVAKVVAEAKPTTFVLTANGYYYLPWKGLGLAGITLAATPELLAYQQKLIDALAPFEVQQGTGAAFVQNPNGQPINEPTIHYVDVFVPEHSGKNFLPHVTVGLAHEEFIKQLAAEKFDPFTVKISGVSIYHLGDFGTAKTKLWSSAGTSLVPTGR
jgi:hypothetical protein